MKHLRIATYAITEGTFAEIAAKTREGLLPKFQEQAGFIRYGVADAGNGMCVSVSLWKSREQALNASSMAADWVRDNLASNVELKANLVGDLAYFEGAKEPVTV
jgi:hypothetical protein